MTTPNDDLSAYTELIPALKTRLLNLRREAFADGWEAGYREGFEAGQRMFISVPANGEPAFIGKILTNDLAAEVPEGRC